MQDLKIVLYNARSSDAMLKSAFRNLVKNYMMMSVILFRPNKNRTCRYIASGHFIANAQTTVWKVRFARLCRLLFFVFVGPIGPTWQSLAKRTFYTVVYAECWLKHCIARSSIMKYNFQILHRVRMNILNFHLDFICSRFLDLVPIPMFWYDFPKLFFLFDILRILIIIRRECFG